MAEEGFKRKLTAILSADVIGYSRLMRDDEEATVRDIAAHRVLIFDIVQKHHGRVVDSPGDNILAEFASVVYAVNGAINIQEEISKSNADTPEDRRMEFRIGINLGDVIEEKEVEVKSESIDKDSDDKFEEKAKAPDESEETESKKPEAKKAEDDAGDSKVKE